MSFLNNPRNTAEVLCHAQKIHRTRRIKNGETIYPGAIVALDPEAGTVEPAGKNPGSVVLGRAEGYTGDGKVIVKTGVFKYENGNGDETLTLKDLNKTVYVLDDQTVGRIGGSNKIIAGVLRDIDHDGQVVIELGNLKLD